MPIITKKQKLLVAIWLFLIVYGIDFELFPLINYDGSAVNQVIILFSTLLLGIYIFPMSLAIRFLKNHLKTPNKFLIIALISGGLITGWLSSIGNGLVYSLLQSIGFDSYFLQDWEAALTAPFVEESIKALMTFAIIYFFKAFKKETVFMTGLTVGFGFQIVEDFAYILTDATEHIDFSIGTALSRMSGALSSHYLYTSVFTLGIFLLVTKSNDIPKKKIITWTILPVFLHFLWNSPLNVSSVVSAVLVTIAIFLFVDVLSFIYQKPSMNH
ncbi:PrsW family intramembrane metalloprotease [Streptococcus pacificus]|uniref:PrsW family intramembrane metalloprotease n=1 Tax=Streptococcus pacificus TaxID=2740577 RepID=A0ABS0ZHG3_9STRE|nr:PrsW family glutamic-type intramembrane protease [Streptococcus pacificus]MBJ8325433.1 PrsW family intramembrane metalloprotease [Streptococcus pacificus]